MCALHTALRILAVPGSQRSIVVAAPIARPNQFDSDNSATDGAHVVNKAMNSANKTRLDRGLDRVVVWSGSWPVFIGLTASIITWAFMGIRYSHDSTWQVFISDYQALLTYFFDSLLMRQQLCDSDERLQVYATIQSRLETYERLFSQTSHAPSSDQLEPVELSDAETIPDETKSGVIMRAGSNLIGHMISVGLFWVGVIIWLAFGPSRGWSPTWQLDMNSGSSAFMVFLFAFLAFTREKHSAHSAACLKAICAVDCRLESGLRGALRDVEPNPTVAITPPPVGIIQRAINYYAQLISMLVGVAILTLVVVLWLALGPVMKFNASWWLLIGTYAGLIGMNDGFVLRNVDQQLAIRERNSFDTISQLEETVLARLQINDQGVEHSRISLSHRISFAMCYLCAHRYAVVAGFGTILILIAVASSLHWSETGQLLANVPPSIIESTFMMILITGHNHAEQTRHDWFKQVHRRRVMLLALVKHDPSGLGFVETPSTESIYR